MISVNFILASKSPRRFALLRQLGLKNLQIHPADIDETILTGDSPDNTACRISAAKAHKAAQSVMPGNNIIIAADTIVYANGMILGKPVDKDDARRMLNMLSGITHEVYTGFTIILNGKEKTDYDITQVTFNNLTHTEIESYINTGDPFDKAGSYGIQGLPALFIAGINGDFYNVMGLPLAKLYAALKQIGINLIDYC